MQKMMNERSLLLVEKLPKKREKRGKDSTRKIDLKGKKERHQSFIIFLSFDIQILNDIQEIEEFPSPIEIVSLERKIGSINYPKRGNWKIRRGSTAQNQHYRR